MLLLMFVDIIFVFVMTILFYRSNYLLLLFIVDVIVPIKQSSYYLIVILISSASRVKFIANGTK